MFIGGLNWETTDGIAFLCCKKITYIDSLRAYFEQFGEIAECTVMRENQTGRSRGFGFLTFVDPKVVNVVMVKEHILDGKIVNVLPTAIL
jgi:RNA-binding protein Musashi